MASTSDSHPERAATNPAQGCAARSSLGLSLGAVCTVRVKRVSLPD
jgi:hypothetical protein